MSDTFVDKGELLRRLDRSYHALDTLLSYAATFDPEASGVCGVWSVKDIVAHVIAHEQRTLEELRLARLGKHLDIKHEEMDSFNDGAVFAYRSAPFAVVREQWQRSHASVVKA